MLNFAYQSIPHFTDAMQNVTMLGLISSLSWDSVYFGQPHIIVRFMAIRSVADIKTARHIGMGWMTVTIVGALAAGLVGIALRQ